MAVIEALKTLMRRVPGRAWLAAGGLLAAALWMQQHDARIRQQVGLQQLRNETSAQVAALRRQAAEDVQQANAQNAQAVAKLEQRRQEAERQNGQLAAQLESLRKQAQIQAGEVATLPISEIVTRVAAQLGLKAEDVTHGPAPDVAKTPHPAAGASTLSPRRGLGQASAADMAKSAIPQGGTPPNLSAGRGLGFAHSADIAKNAISAPAETTPHPPAGASTLSPRRGSDQEPGGQSPPLQNPAALALTASGARKVEASLVALDACRAESDIQARQLSNCRARAEADEAAIEQLKGSVDSLNHALAAKDKILVEQQSQYKAELRAARGTFLGRLARLSEHVAIGVAVGVAIGAAAK